MNASGPPRMPRWVRIFAIIALLLVVVVVATAIAGVEHGPGRHSAAPDASSAPPSSGHRPPPGVDHGDMQP